MAKQALIAIATAFLIVSAIVDGNAASTLKVLCSGNLTNTPAGGDTLGQCDLNFITVKEMDEIEKVCGIPGTIDSPNETKCRIRALSHLIQFGLQITASYTRCLKCGRWIIGDMTEALKVSHKGRR